MPTTPTVVILAGGPSRRFGSHKPAATVGDRTMLEWVVGAAGDLPSLVIGGPEVDLTRWIADEVRDGPAGALAVACSAVDGPVIVVGADQPWVRAETLHALADFPADAAFVPVDDERRQVTCARYPAGIAEMAERGAAAGGGLQEVLDMVPRNEVPEERWRSWNEDGRSWYSVNFPDDIPAGVVRFGPPA
jgi:molybdopterin-guanine dinucleotide biosynthesis protein A